MAPFHGPPVGRVNAPSSGDDILALVPVGRKDVGIEIDRWLVQTVTRCPPRFPWMLPTRRRALLRCDGSSPHHGNPAHFRPTHSNVKSDSNNTSIGHHCHRRFSSCSALVTARLVSFLASSVA